MKGKGVVKGGDTLVARKRQLRRQKNGKRTTTNINEFSIMRRIITRFSRRVDWQGSPGFFCFVSRI